ncbi:MAG: NAD-dependent epimerase/dehydratase family protein [Sphingobacteriales bacterium]|nr:MAG: NAD-dependent epimerase/dehydratase family protein [Sphingobacteriales bacterium]
MRALSLQVQVKPICFTVGSRLASRLRMDGHHVHALVRNEPPPGHTLDGIQYFRGDIIDKPSLERAVHGCEQVYHVAGYARLWAAKRKTFFDINVTGTENVLETALNAGVRRLVFTSSCAVFGPSLRTAINEETPRITAFNNDYDLSKLLAEGSVREYCGKGLETVTVNPSRVYGPGPGTHANMITRMLIKSMRGQWVLMPGIMDVIGNYAFVDDVVDGHIKAMQHGDCGERYIIGGENLSYRQVIDIIKKEIRQPRLLPLPAGAVKAWGYIELLKNKLTGAAPKFTPQAVGRYLADAAVDSTKAVDQLGYSITGFRHGIQQTITYLKHSK